MQSTQIPPVGPDALTKRIAELEHVIANLRSRHMDQLAALQAEVDRLAAGNLNDDPAQRWRIPLRQRLKFHAKRLLRKVPGAMTVVRQIKKMGK